MADATSPDSHRYLARRVVGSALVVVALSAATLAHADSADAPLVDRAVSDLDPLATSSRVLDPAFANDLNRARLFELEPGDPLTGQRPQFQFVAPGFRATFDRPDYLTLSEDGITLNQAPAFDGAFVELIPPNTVFDLTLPQTSEPLEPTPEMRRWQVDTRWDARIGPQPRYVGQGWGHLGPDWEPDDSGFGTFASTQPADDTGKGQAAPVQLQPWVTAEDLREHQAEIPLITDRVVLPGDPESVPTMTPADE